MHESMLKVSTGIVLYCHTSILFTTNLFQIKKQWYVTVNEFRDFSSTGIRQYERRNGRQYPTKNGVGLMASQFYLQIEVLQHIIDAMHVSYM